MEYPIKIFSGNSNIQFAEKVAKIAGIELGQCEIKKFSDGESQVEIKESVRGCHCFVIQSTCPPVNEHYMELFIMIDALHRASAKEITAVMPYYGYARQDKKIRARAPISAKVVANLLGTSGAQRLVSIDLHSSQIQGFFSGPVDHLYSTKLIANTWLEKHGEEKNCVVVSPDAGGVERAQALAKRIKCPIAIIDKRRPKPNEAKALHVIGDVSGKTAIVVDDIIDTAGTLTQCIDSLLKNGAKRVFAVATHPVLSGRAVEKLVKCGAQKIWVTDTIPLSKEAIDSKKFEVISMSPLVANVIHSINNHKSVSALF